MAIDIVYVDADGFFRSASLNYDGDLPEPAADAGVAGHVDVTAEAERSQILAGERRWVSGAWVTFAALTDNSVPMDIWWARWMFAERDYLVEAADTDLYVRQYLRAFRLITVYLNNDTDYTTFIEYLKTDHVGAGLLWPDAGTADARAELINANY